MTALRMLAWATDPAGPPPAGPLRRVDTLAVPGQHVVEAIQRLSVATAARLGAGRPPLDDPGPVGLGVLLIAAASGGRHEEKNAMALLDGVPPDRGAWAERVTRHGLVGPLLADPPDHTAVALPNSLAEVLRRASPLTAVLSYPPNGPTATARATTIELISRPGGTGMLVATLAAPVTDAAILNWRAELLELLRHERPAVALDVYVAARLWHAAAWAERIGWAGRELASYGIVNSLAIATLRFWAPLARMYRDETVRSAMQHSPSIAERIFLRSTDIAPAIRLVKRYHLMQEVTA